jgi:serine/threonine-protein kinase
MTSRTRVGSFELLESVGQGNIFTIYRARDTERDRLVILKLLQHHLTSDKDLVDRLRREAGKLISLRHSLIVPVHDVVADADGVYLVSDVPQGESLEQRLASRGPLEVDSILLIVSQLANALDYAYERGVLHHDVRPANVYLDDDNTARLADFYLLEAVGATPVYMAPEQLDETSAESADRRSDVYALGIVVYEMLTGRLPFEGTEADVAAAHLAQRPTPPRIHNPDLLPALDAILLKSLSKQPYNRYQTASKLASALHEAVQTALTRRMSDDGVFDIMTRPADDPVYGTSSVDNEDGAPVWIWVGVGILLLVVIATVILLATS